MTRFKDAVQHLESLGLVVEGTGGKPHSGRRRLHNPLRSVPVRVARNGMLSPELLEMIRESRAELDLSSRSRKRR